MAKSDTTDQPPLSDAPYIFKRYLDGGGVVYEVSQHGKTLSIHPDVPSAQKALDKTTYEEMDALIELQHNEIERLRAVLAEVVKATDVGAYFTARRAAALAIGVQTDD